VAGVLGFGAGIAQGSATLGQIGFSERSGYTAIGTSLLICTRRHSPSKPCVAFHENGTSRIGAVIVHLPGTKDLGDLAPSPFRI